MRRLLGRRKVTSLPLSACLVKAYKMISGSQKAKAPNRNKPFAPIMVFPPSLAPRGKQESEKATYLEACEVRDWPIGLSQSVRRTSAHHASANQRIIVRADSM